MCHSKHGWLGNRALESSVDFKSCRVDRLGPESKIEAAEESALVKDKKIAKFEDQRKDKFRKLLDVTTANDEKDQAKYMLQELGQLDRQRARRFCGTGAEVCKKERKEKVGRARRGSHDGFRRKSGVSHQFGTPRGADQSHFVA